MRLKTKDSLFQMRFISLPRGASVFKGVKETAAIPSLEAPAHNTSNEHFVKKNPHGTKFTIYSKALILPIPLLPVSRTVNLEKVILKQTDIKN